MARHTSLPGMTQISHIGIAVRSIEQAHRLYSLLGFEQHSPVQEIAREGTRVLMLVPDQSQVSPGSIGIELLEPLARDSPVGRFLDGKGEGLHHIALQVDDIAAVLEKVRKEGISVTPGGIRQSAVGHSYFFLHPSSSGGVLIEICQAAEPPGGK